MVHANGALVISRDDSTGKSFGERIFSTYPLRFIACNGGDRIRKRKSREDTTEKSANFNERERIAMYFMVGFGGGYVSETLV